LATNNLSNASTLWVTAATGGTATSPVSGDTWNFANTAGATLNNNFSNAFTVAGITFISTAGATTINGNSINLSGDIINNGTKVQTLGTAFVLTGNRTFSTASGGNLLFNGSISGAFGITTIGTGTTTLAAANTYSGGTFVNSAAPLVISNSLALQNSALNISSTSIIRYGSGTTNYTLGGLQGGGSAIINMTNAASNAIALTFNNNNNNSTNFQGFLRQTVAGATVTKTGTGVQTLSGSNNYSGVTRVNGGALNFLTVNSLYGNSNSLQTASNIIVASNATVAVGFNNFGSNAVFSLLTKLTNTAGATGLQAGAAFGFDTTGTDLILSSNLGNSANGALGYAVLGTGTLTLTGNNTYTGNTWIYGGTLRYGAGLNSIGVAGTGGTLLLTNTTTISNAINVGSALTQNNGGFNVTNTGLLSGSGTLTVTNTGTTTLNPGLGNTSTLGGFLQTGGTVVLTNGTLNLTSTGNGGNSGFLISQGTAFINEGTTLLSGGGATGSEALIGRLGSGTLTMNGGSWTHSGSINIGYGALSHRSVLNMNGGTITARVMNIGVGSTNQTLNLNGGVINVINFANTQANVAGVINFNGGMIRAATNQASFIAVSTSSNSSITNNILAGGLVFDTAGFAVGITNDLLGSVGDGGLTLTNSTGNGVLTLSGNNTYVGNTTIGTNATLIIGGAGRLGAGNYAGNIITAGTNSALTFSGTVQQNLTGLISGTGTINQNGSGTTTLNPGVGMTNSIGSLILTNGTVEASSGTLNVTTAQAAGNNRQGLGLYGGSLLINGANVLAYNYMTLNTGSKLSVTNGSLTVTGLILNAYGAGGSTMTLAGSGTLNALGGIRPSQNALGTMNLDGGTLNTSFFDTGGNSRADIFLNGTVINPTAARTDFMNANTNILYKVMAGGAKFNLGGFNGTNYSITVAANLQSGTNNDGGLTLNASGTNAATLTLSGTNSYNGVTTINGGTLAIGAANAIATNNAVVVNSLGTLLLNASQTLASLTGSGSVTFSNSALSINVANGSNNIFSGNISGQSTFFALNGDANSFSSSGTTGTLTLSGSNSYTTTVGNVILGGTLVAGSSNAFGSTNNNWLHLDGTLDVGSFNVGVGAVSIGNGTITGNGTLSGRSFTSFNPQNSFMLISASLAGAGATFNHDSMGGTVVLAASNSFSGVTTVTAGTLVLSNSFGLGGSTFDSSGLASGGRLVFGTNTTAFAFGGLQGNANLALTNELGQALALTVGANNTNTDFSGGLTDGGMGGSLTKSGTGTLSLSGANNYTGGTVLNSGTLAISNNAAFGTGTVTFASNSTVRGLADLTITNNYIIASGATATQDNGGFALINTGLLRGSGTLTATGTGTTTLSPGIGNTNMVGRFFQSGGTVVLTNGTLSVTNTNSGAFSIRGDTIINSGATLRTAGSPSIIGGDIPGGAGTLTMNGGSWIQSGAFIAIGYGASAGVLNMGGGTITAPQIQLGQGGGLERTLNLNGGVIIVSSLFNTGASTRGVINFNGGMIRSSGNQANFIQAGGTITNKILAGGLVFDTAGFAVGITNNLQSGTNVVDGGLKLTNSTGNGTLTLSGSNSYTGGTTINGGTLLANHQQALAGGNVTVNNGGTLLLTNINQTVGNVTLGNATISGSGTLTGTSYTATNSLNASISESLAGSGTLTMNGAGTLTLSGSNSSYSGGTLLNSGAINITTAKALGNGELTMAGGSLGYSGLTSTSINNQISVTSATATIANLTGNGANTLTLDGGINLNNNALTLSGGSFAARDISGSLGSLGLSSATATLSGNNTYGGTTTLLGGSTLNLGVANGISTNSAVTLGDGSNTLNLSGNNQSLTSLNSTSGNSLNQVVNNSATLATLTLTGNSSFAGSLNGNLGLTANAGSNGVVSLTGTTSSYTGQTLVQSGSLNLGNNTTLTATSNVVVANGATLLLSGNNNIHTSAPLALQGGTLSMGGQVGQGIGATRASAQTFASLTLTANSTIDFSSLSGNSSLTFNTITMNGNELFVFNWSSNVTRLFDSSTSSLSAMDLNNISFFSGGIGSSTFLGKGTFSGTEIVPVPEPSVIMAAALLLGWMLFANRGVLINLISRRRSA
jgi:autotransporter-associated beta strand protein